MMRRLVVLLLVFSVAAPIHAQTIACPPGSQPYGGGNAGWIACTPVPEHSQLATPSPEWSSRWGAIATANGAFGTANDATSKRKAEKEALKQCKAQGGKDCIVLLSFHNQCAALAWGDTNNFASGHPELQGARANALKNCSAATANCQIYYEGCSYPKRIR